MQSEIGYDVGLYCRLSRDDKNYGLASMSIQNQEMLLRDYVTERGWNLVDVFIDDGYSGTNFDRPEFKRLIEYVEKGIVNCVITKDLSRLGRNYVEAGRYTDVYFPEMDVRYIALNDGFDSDVEASQELVAFHHVINEIYPKQVSKKVRQVKAANARQGKFMGSQAPYGYMKHPLDKHQLIPDPFARQVIIRIYRMYVEGNSARHIADVFNGEKLDSPMYYHYAQLGKTPTRNVKNEWGSCTIMQIIENQVYAGDMVQGKRQVASFKTKRRKCIAPSQWIVVEDTHEPLVSRDLWQLAQHRKKHKRIPRTTKQGVSLFSGLLRCADCGSRLAYFHKEKKYETIHAYRCSRYMNNGKNACSTHFIRQEHLVAIVTEDIRRYARLAQYDRDTLVEKLLETALNMKTGRTAQLRRTRLEIQGTIDELGKKIKSLFEEKHRGSIPEDIFKSLMTEYSAERSSLEEKLTQIDSEYTEASYTQAEMEHWVDTVALLTDIRELDRGLLLSLVDTIVIGERKFVDDEYKQEIHINYNFIGSFEDKEKEDIA